MKTIINIKADKGVKELASAVAADMGLPLSTVVNAFLKQFIAERRVEFVAPFRPSKDLEKIILAASKDVKKGKNISPLFRDSGNLNTYLDGLES